MNIVVMPLDRVYEALHTYERWHTRITGKTSFLSTAELPGIIETLLNSQLPDVEYAFSCILDYMEARNMDTEEAFNMVVFIFSVVKEHVETFIPMSPGVRICVRKWINETTVLVEVEE